MGAIVAILNKNQENVIPEAILALKTLAHRGEDAHGIATQNQVLIAKTIEELETEHTKSNVILGHNLVRIFPTDTPQPILSEGFVFVFEGRLFSTTTKTSTEEFEECLGNKPQENAVKATALDGSFAFAIANRKEIIAGRDPLGTIPLYYGENPNLCAVASERKALWKLNISNTYSFVPGKIATITKNGFSFKTAKKLTQQPIKATTMEEATKQLQNLLLQSCKKRISDVNKVAVAFSGGLDSSLVALFAKLCDVKVHLITVGLEGQQEIQHAKYAASALGLPIHVKTYTLNDVEKILSRILWLMEEPNVTQLAIAIPFFWTAEQASQLGFHVLLAGQGSDELFGGYRKYLDEYARFGVEGLQEAICHDVVMSYENNFERDNKVCAFHNIELRLPFADFELASFALSLPPQLKIESAEDILRKRVLRNVAQSLRMPPFIVDRAKKAIQYTTGVNKAIKKLARKEGLTLKECVEKHFQEVYPYTKESK